MAEREMVRSELRRAMGGVESLRRLLEGGPPYEHDYPARDTPDYAALNNLDAAFDSLRQAAVTLGFSVGDLTAAP